MPAMRTLACCIGVIVLTWSTSAQRASVGGSHTETVRLQLKWRHQFQFAGYYAALTKGFYRDAGLAVEILEIPNDREPSDVVLAGDADFGVGMSDLVVLRSKGYPIVVLAAVYQHSPLVLLCNAKSGIRSVHDLVGKRVMLEPHSEELVAYFESESISLSDMVVQPHSFDTKNLLNGDVDAMTAYATDEPFVLSEAGMAHTILSPRSGGIDFYGDTLYTTEQQIENNPERVRRFVDASIRGWEYALRHQDEMIEHILTEYGDRHSREHLAFEAEKARRLVMSDVIEIGYMNPGRWQHITQVYRSLSMIPADFTLDGFIYDRDPAPDLRSLYTALIIIAAVAVVISLVAIRTSRLNRSLRQALQEIRVLRGILPICAACKKIRDDQGYWNQIESYISAHSDTEFTHGICPDCAHKLYPQYFDRHGEKKS